MLTLKNTITVSELHENDRIIDKVDKITNYNFLPIVDRRAAKRKRK